MERYQTIVHCILLLLQVGHTSSKEQSTVRRLNYISPKPRSDRSFLLVLECQSEHGNAQHLFLGVYQTIVLGTFSYPTTAWKRAENERHNLTT